MRRLRGTSYTERGNSTANVIADRCGFTLIELLVVIGITSLLMSMVLPAVMRARSSARRIQCVSNLRQLSLAMVANAEKNDRLPAAGHFSASGPDQYHNWVTTIMGEIEQNVILERYDFDKPWSEPNNFALTSTHLSILTCPEDISVADGQGNLSYVVNCGFSWTIPVDCPAFVHNDAGTLVTAPMDFNGNGVVCPIDPASDGGPTDRDQLERTSLFFVENWPIGSGTHRFHRLSSIRDGGSQTLMLSENIRAGYSPIEKTSWGNPDPRYIGFFVSSYICEGGECSDGKVDLRRANDRSTEPFRNEAINASLDQPEGLAPWPSSQHPGVVNFSFCDGHVKPISIYIDGSIYAALATPQGSLTDGPLKESVVSDNAF